MAIAFDAVSPGATGTTGTTSPLTWTHTLVSGLNSVVLVWVTLDMTYGDPDTGYVFAVTCGGTPMNAVATVHSNASNIGFGTLFQLTGVSAGAKTITATASGGTHLDLLSGGSISYTGVNQASPLGAVTTATGSGTTTYTTATATLPSTTSGAGNLVAGFVVAGSTLSAATAPSTSRFRTTVNSPGAAGGAGAGADSPSTGSAVTMAWTISSADYFGEVIAELQAFHSTGGQDPFMPQGLSRLQARRRKMAQRPQYNLQSPSVNIQVSALQVTATVPVPQPPYLTQVLGTGTTQYLADQNGQPWLCRGDSCWGLPVNAGVNGGATTWQSDIALYFATRYTQGFNTVILDCPSGGDITGIGTSGHTWDGVAPWSPSMPTMNTTWWQRLDLCITTAAQYGFTVFLACCDFYALDGGALNGMTTAQATAYGTELAARYGASPNIVWLFGNDYNGGYDSIYTNILTALRAGGANQLCTIENQSESTSRHDLSTGDVEAWGNSYAQINGVYTYCGVYPAVNYAYAESSVLCVLYVDGWYDGFTTTVQNARDFMRNQVWWGLSSGSRGYVYGRGGESGTDVWAWNAGASVTLATNPFDNTDLKAIWNAFTALPEWWQLVPDISSALVTAGRGTALGLYAGESNNAYTGETGGSNVGGGQNYYVTASKTPDGNLAVIYIPNAANAITVNGSLMTSGYTAQWMDPVTGTLTSATIGSTYSHSGSNSQGAPDWVLVLAAPVGGNATPATLAVTATFPAAAGSGAVTLPELVMAPLIPA